MVPEYTGVGESGHSWPSPYGEGQGQQSFGWLQEENPPKTPVMQHAMLDAVGMLGSLSWAPGEQEEACLLLEEFEDVFSQHDLNLRETSLVKHIIYLRPNTGAPFKELY